jgi:hypothetical protein
MKKDSVFTFIMTHQLVHSPDSKKFIGYKSELWYLGKLHDYISLTSHQTGESQLFLFNGHKTDPDTKVYYWEYTWVQDTSFPQLKDYTLMIYDK